MNVTQLPWEMGGQCGSDKIQDGVVLEKPLTQHLIQKNSHSSCILIAISPEKENHVSHKSFGLAGTEVLIKGEI